MQLFQKHIISSVLLAIYVLWWAFVLYYALVPVEENVKNSCTPVPMAIISISLLLGTLYTGGFMIKSLITKEPDRTDYLIFAGITVLPLVIGGAYVISYS